jgi:hypothetical protein
MEEVKLAEVISRVIQAVLGDLIPVTKILQDGEIISLRLVGSTDEHRDDCTLLTLKGLGQRRICR